MGFYLESKGLGVKGHVKKSWREKRLNSDQVKKILTAVTDAKKDNPLWWWRDYGLIYLGYFLGLRIGEACLLEKRQFENLEEHDEIHVPTLKKGERIAFSCKHCNRKCRVAAIRMGKLFPCPRCNRNSLVRPPNHAVSTAVPETDPPFIEPQVRDFLMDYLAHMRSDQKFLFESSKGRHVSRGYVSRIFATYSSRAGLSSKFSFHALRHGRGSTLFSIHKDLVTVMKGLRHSSIKSAQVYADLDEDMRKETRAKLARKAFKAVEAPTT